MRKNIKSSLLPFYFGSVTENERLEVERELLLDSGLLTEFFDLKRKVEAAEAIPLGPSNSIWTSITTKLEAKKRIIIPLTFGAAIAASVIVFMIFLDMPKEYKKEQNKGEKELIFDSSSELPVSSNVL